MIVKMWKLGYIATYIAMVLSDHAGIQFEPRGELILISQNHQVFAEVSPEEFFYALRHAFVILNTIQRDIFHVYFTNTSSGTREKFRINFASVTTHLELLQQRALEIVKHAGSAFKTENRRKRSLIPSLGKIFGTELLGLVNEDQLREISEQIGAIDTTQDSIIRKVNENSHVIYQLGRDTVEMHRVIQQLANVTEELEESEEKMFELIDEVRLQAITNKVEVALNAFEESIHRLLAGELPDRLVPEDSLLKIINFLKINGHKPLFEREIYRYYKLATVVLLPPLKPKRIRFAIILPLRTASKRLALTEIKTIPIWNDTLKMAMQFAPENRYLAISEDRTIFSVMNNLDICKKESHLTICPATRPLYVGNKNICEYNLYVSNPETIIENVHNCPRKIISKMTPFFEFNAEGFYTYSVKNAMTFDIECDTVKGKQWVKLTDQGTLKLNKSCRAVNKDVILMGNSIWSSENKSFEIKPFEGLSKNVLNEKEMAKIAENLGFTKTLLHSLPDQQYPLEHLLQNLDQAVKTSEYHNWKHAHQAGTLSSFTTALLIIISIIMAIYLRYKYCGHINCSEKLSAVLPQPAEEMDQTRVVFVRQPRLT